MPERKYNKYKIIVAPESKRTQGLQVGDIVRRQYIDASNTIYSLMVVLDAGVDVVTKNDGTEGQSPYFIGALIEGDEPKSGELLDFIRISNLFDIDRSGALYLTASDPNTPYMDVLSGTGTSKSLCFPTQLQLAGDLPMPNTYWPLNPQFFVASYIDIQDGNSRVVRLNRNSIENNQNESYGLKQHILRPIESPASLILSFKARSLKSTKLNLSLLDYYALDNLEWTDNITVNAEWQYFFKVIDVLNPNQLVGEKTYPQHSVIFDLKNSGLNADEWIEIADLNFILLSDIASLTDSHKGRIGNLTGILDPVFGFLRGFGSYFQNLYATKNVNIAGTLSAGDENGVSSTFYVGRIHKNCYLNSSNPLLNNEEVKYKNIFNPVGFGQVVLLPPNDGSAILAFKNIQNRDWVLKHVGETVTFSFYYIVSMQYNQETGNRYVGIKTDSNKLKVFHQFSPSIAGEWNRTSFKFKIEPELCGDNDFWSFFLLDDSKTGLFICAPQLEFNEQPTLYQPTDGILNDTDAYGAWFNRGGIGGTIQNPLLKLNDDGSIESGDGAFKIEADGTGSFANGKFKWTHDTIELIDYTLKWKDLDEETQTNMKQKSIMIVGPTSIHYNSDRNTSTALLKYTIEPLNIDLKESEIEWFYMSKSGEWVKTNLSTTDTIEIRHNESLWQDQDTLLLAASCRYRGTEYKSSITINKLYDGADSYILTVDSSNGTIFKNGKINTILTATVYKGGVDITDTLSPSQLVWTRTSSSPEDDEKWNNEGHVGSTLLVDKDMVDKKATFSCDLYPT